MHLIRSHSYYQLAFFTPGSCPKWANSLKQSRQRPNLRKYPRGLPHFKQRFFFWTSYLNFFLTILETLAIFYPSLNGIPKSSNSFLDLCLSLAEVTIVTAIPLTLSIVL